MRKETKQKSPDGYTQIEEVINDLYGLIISNNTNLTFVKVLRLIIEKLKFSLELLSYNPRLPFEQIEDEITNMCNKDRNLHGVQVICLFKGRHPNTDMSKFGDLKIEILKK